MTVSELKYLMAVDGAAGEGEEAIGARMSDIARELNVSKVSVYHGMEKLEEGGYIERAGKQFRVTAKGEQILAEYRKVMSFISGHLEHHCGIAAQTAQEDALGAACAFSDESRRAIAAMLSFGR